MMEAIVARLAGVAPVSYDAARATVGRWHRAGVTILAGTDANQAPSAPASPPYGTSLHHELALLVDAGLSAFEALRSATAGAAQQFGLADRGVIAPGKRADLVLIDGDPAQEISRRSAASQRCGAPADRSPTWRRRDEGHHDRGARRRRPTCCATSTGSSAP
jgi:imidazolonepropionase-like amidohydrolase